MKFRLKTCIVLSKEFEIEAENLNDATKMVEKLVMEEGDLSGFELIRKWVRGRFFDPLKWAQRCQTPLRPGHLARSRFGQTVQTFRE